MPKTQEKGEYFMPYQIPRNVKGEGRILYIFSTKSLIYAGIGGFIRTNYRMDSRNDRIGTY